MEVREGGNTIAIFFLKYPNHMTKAIQLRFWEEVEVRLGCFYLKDIKIVKTFFLENILTTQSTYYQDLRSVYSCVCMILFL